MAEQPGSVVELQLLVVDQPVEYGQGAAVDAMDAVQNSQFAFKRGGNKWRIPRKIVEEDRRRKKGTCLVEGSRFM